MNDACLKPWMTYLLRFAAGFNLVAGISMILFYHEGFRMLDMPKPEIVLPVQTVGMLVALFGAGYWMVANAPRENRNVLLLGMLSKAFGSVLVIYNCLDGKLPWVFLPIVFFADLVYVPPFWRILKTIPRA
jgi:hypothetical protein